MVVGSVPTSRPLFLPYAGSFKYRLVSEPFADSRARGVPSKITLPPLFPLVDSGLNDFGCPRMGAVPPAAGALLQTPVGVDGSLGTGSPLQSQQSFRTY